MAETRTTLADTATQALRSIERVGTNSPAFDGHRDRLLACITELRAAEAALCSRALADVVAERARQTTAEGWTAEHDDHHNGHELQAAAEVYLLGAYATPGRRRNLIARFWPWDTAWYKPTTPRRDLVKAAALILAEIDRIDRAAAKGGDHG